MFGAKTQGMLDLPGHVWAKGQNHQVGPHMTNSSELMERVPFGGSMIRGGQSLQ